MSEHLICVVTGGKAVTGSGLCALLFNKATVVSQLVNRGAKIGQDKPSGDDQLLQEIHDSTDPEVWPVLLDPERALRKARVAGGLPAEAPKAAAPAVSEDAVKAKALALTKVRITPDYDDGRKCLASLVKAERDVGVLRAALKIEDRSSARDLIEERIGELD